MMINFGIDLGTTNSAIAVYKNGQVEILRNPAGLKQTLPSVVAFRKNRIQIGDKAREFLEKDPGNVLASFKRKMGTSESFLIQSTGESISPVSLSAHILKELKQFVHAGEPPKAAVVTIPASFDTIQSNATKKAAYEAGFEEVVLLQEPIAASLAYANAGQDEHFEEGQWLVYDLGGGTFDIALIRIKDGEMKVIDHEGDNFLGGTDIDHAIVEKLIVPRMEAEGQFTDLLSELKNASGKFNKLYHVLVHKAEEAKIQLSQKQDTEIEFEVTDDSGAELDLFFELTRADLQVVLDPIINRSLELLGQIISRNNLTPTDLKFVLMVGGSSYIPAVRYKVGEFLDIPVNCDIDPTTAVALGAAYFAGTRPISEQKTPDKAEEIETESGQKIRVKTAFSKVSQDDRELFLAQIQPGNIKLQYRIIRLDGGYDSGFVPFQGRIQEELPLLKQAFNQFQLKIFDSNQELMYQSPEPIGITHGKFAVAGQPLPNDICLEIDNPEKGHTTLEVVFEKNSVLPSRKTIVKEITQTIPKGSKQAITINVVEGPSFALPAANQQIGFIRISGKDLDRDLIKGSDIEITLEMTESRDLTINAYLLLTDQEFENVFNPSIRSVDQAKLTDDINILLDKIAQEVQESEYQENYEMAGQLQKLRDELRQVSKRLGKLGKDDVTDEKFQIEDTKRKIAQQIDMLTGDKRLNQVKMDFILTRKAVKAVIDSDWVEAGDKESFDKIVQQEKSLLASNNILRIEETTNKLNKLWARIRWRDPEHVKDLYYYFCSQAERFSNRSQGKQLMKDGESAIDEQKWDRLRNIVNELWQLLPESKKGGEAFEGGTGIG